MVACGLIDGRVTQVSILGDSEKVVLGDVEEQLARRYCPSLATSRLVGCRKPLPWQVFSPFKRDSLVVFRNRSAKITPLSESVR